MNIKKTARNFAELNAPSPELMDDTLRLMRETRQAGHEKNRRNSGWRRFRVAAGAVAAVMVLLIGTNLAFPAFAESLPFIGSVFRFINDRSRGYSESMNAAQDRISEYAVNVSLEEGSTITVPAANIFERAITVQLREVYYDGNFVFAGLGLQLGADSEYLTEIRGSKYGITINGESQVYYENGQEIFPSGTGNGFCDLSDYYLTRVGDGAYVMLKGFRVPDHLQGADSLEVELCFDGFYDSGIPVNSSGFVLPFTVQKKEIPTKEISCEGMEVNGVRLLSATSNPVVTYLELEYPETYNDPGWGASFDDGISIGAFGGEEYPPENGVVRVIGAYAGLKEDETRNIVWSLFDRNGSHQYEATFVLDFANGTAHIGSEEDIKKAPIGDYACGVEAIQNLPDGYIVEKYHAEQSKPMLYLASGSGKRADLWVEVWQDDTLLESQQIHWNDNGWTDDDFLYFEYEDDGDILNRIPDTEHTVYMMILQNGYAGLDMTHPLTVKVYDSARELVLDQEITLEVHEN